MNVVIAAARKRRESLFYESAALVYSAAMLNGYAYHNPSKMPNFDQAFPPPSKRGKATAASESERAMAAMRAATGMARARLAKQKKGQV